jgi:hypothetical protein
MRKLFQHVRPDNLCKMLLQQNNTMPQASITTQKAITQLGWMVLPHPPYSPSLAPSDFQLFRPLKDGVPGRKFESDNDLVRTVKTWLRQQDNEWYWLGIRALVPHWHKAIELHTEFVENS